MLSYEYVEYDIVTGVNCAEASLFIWYVTMKRALQESRGPKD